MNKLSVYARSQRWVRLLVYENSTEIVQIICLGNL